MDYGKHFSTRQTPQSEAIPSTTQVANSAEGFAWTVDDWVRLDRFLILGSEGSTYYIQERVLTQENAQAVLRCLKTDGLRTVERIVQISESGRAPKNDPAIFALAMAAAEGDLPTKAAALAALPRVCRIGTHLFHFAQAVQSFRGWGRSLRRAIGTWYNTDLNAVTYQVVKYAQRDGWTHKDLLRLAHPTPATVGHNQLFKWVTKGTLEGAEIPNLVFAMQELQVAQDAKRVAQLIRQYDLPREAVESANTKWLKELLVWEALLEKMPLTAMVRNLARMTANGLITPMSNAAAHVVRELSNEHRIRKSRLHPVALLSAQRVYAQGRGKQSRLTWAAVSQIVDALDAAFYQAFDNVPSTGKRIVLALDISGSMASGTIAGVPGITPREMSAALALVTAAREPNHAIVGFSCSGSKMFRSSRSTGISLLPISARQRLSEVMNYIDKLDFGGTDCALPMLWALNQHIDADGFVILTDSETWTGWIHPTQALQQYRQVRGIRAKLVIVGMVSNGFSIADPMDGGMLDIVGCDTATPNLIADFLLSS